MNPKNFQQLNNNTNKLSNENDEVLNYVLDKNINLPQMEYSAEIDGDYFPDRDQHLKNKEQILEEYQLIKKLKGMNRVRR